MLGFSEVTEVTGGMGRHEDSLRLVRKAWNTFYSSFLSQPQTLEIKWITLPWANSTELKSLDQLLRLRQHRIGNICLCSAIQLTDSPIMAIHCIMY